MKITDFDAFRKPFGMCNLLNNEFLNIIEVFLEKKLQN